MSGLRRSWLTTATRRCCSSWARAELRLVLLARRASRRGRRRAAPRTRDEQHGVRERGTRAFEMPDAARPTRPCRSRASRSASRSSSSSSARVARSSARARRLVARSASASLDVRRRRRARARAPCSLRRAASRAGRSRPRTAAPRRTPSAATHAREALEGAGPIDAARPARSRARWPASPSRGTRRGRRRATRSADSSSSIASCVSARQPPRRRLASVRLPSVTAVSSPGRERATRSATANPAATRCGSPRPAARLPRHGDLR